MKFITRLKVTAALIFFAAINSATAGPQEAELLMLSPPVKLLAPGASPSGETHSPVFEEKELSLPEAKALMASKDGKHWSILSVKAPACEKAKGKDCRANVKECKAADKFAHKYRKHATCSALYTQTKVLLIPAAAKPTAD